MRERETQNQRVYDNIKLELQRGDFMPGERLTGDDFAHRYGTSSTPVRMAFSRLQGERMIEGQADEGFHAPTVTETSLRDLFVLNLHQIRLCTTLIKTDGFHNGDLDMDELQKMNVVSATETLFATVASATGNTEMVAIISNLNDRLHLIRTLKDSLLPGRDVEVHRLADRWRARDLSGFNQLLREHHRRRLAKVREIVIKAHRPRQRVT